MKLDHLKEILAGYVAAVAVACIITALIFIVLTLHPSMLVMLLHPLLFVPFFVFSFGVTSMYALPGWLLSVFISERFAIKSKVYFCAVGVMASLVAAMIFQLTDSAFLGKSFKGLELMLASGAVVIGGLCGGLTYWAIAGKHSGTWKSAQ